MRTHSSVVVFAAGAAALAAPSGMAADRYWANSGTDFNAGASWTGGVAPGAGDRAFFTAAPAMQPQVTAPATLFGLFFTPALGTDAGAATADCGGYVLEAAPGVSLTLTAAGYNWNGVYMMEQCTTGTNRIAAAISFPDETAEKHRYIHLVAGTMEIAGPIAGNSNNVLRVGGGKESQAFILSGDNTAFTGGFTKASPFPILIRNSNALSRLTRLEFSLHGSQAFAASRFVNQTGGPLVFPNNPRIFLNGGDGVHIESDHVIDFGAGTVAFNDGNDGRSCPLHIVAPLVKIGGPTIQTSNRNGYVKRGAGTLAIGGPSSYLGETFVADGVFLARHPEAVSPRSALRLCKAYDATTGGILGLGHGDFTNAPGTTAGCFAGKNDGGYYNEGGWAAYGADRVVNIGNDRRAVTNIMPMLDNIILGAPDADATVTFLNPLHTQGATWYAYDGAADVDGRFAGAITNHAGAWPVIVKRGAGTLDLAADNPLTGTLNIQEGRLLVSGATGPSLAVNVKSGGILGGGGVVAGNIVVETNGAFAVDNRIGTATLLGNLIFDAGAGLQIALDGGAAAGISFGGAGRKLRNNGTVRCVVHAAGKEIVAGTMKVIDWSAAVNPDVSGLDAAQFVIANDDEFAGVFEKRAAALVLKYRSCAVRPGVIIVR
jgi:autotransporter-associated beta strand protein